MQRVDAGYQLCTWAKNLWGALALAVIIIVAPSLAWADEPDYTRTEDVIYGRKYGTALTLDVFRLDKPNGAAVIF